ncbi:MAG: zeta toxin family protein [Alphaproteobacteria bacterium]|nr:zeta toxin family protein [Alphaproteobacteria bacterium]
MWIIAGPNGAGKSSFAGDFLADLGHKNLIKLNADELTAALRKKFPDAAQNDLNLQAAIEIDQKVVDYIDAGQSFVVETVLSSPKYQDDVLTAKQNGFKVGLVYVSLYPPELSPQRIEVRVAKGGHNVDHDKAIERHRKSHEQLSWFAPKADALFIFDNSQEGTQPTLIALRGGDQPIKYLAPGVNPSVDRALKDIVSKKSINPDFSFG